VWNVHKILAPVALPEAFTDSSRHSLHEAAWLARRFHAEIILLHVVPRLDYPYGALESGHEMTADDLHMQAVQTAQKALDQAILPEFQGIPVTRLLLRGDPAEEIIATASDRNADLLVLSTHGHGALYRLLLGSVTAKVLHETQCPVWTSAHIDEAASGGEETAARDFSIRRVLCSVDLKPHNRHTLARAAEMAAAVGAALTVVHITSSVESFGPGGSLADAEWKKTIVGRAAEEIAALQRDVGTKAEVIIDSGNVPELLNREAERTKADVLVIGHIPGRSHLGANGEGYGIIRRSRIPVLSV
jgi:nucleotide-binding universal stress UspA family protein